MVIDYLREMIERCCHHGQLIPKYNDIPPSPWIQLEPDALGRIVCLILNAAVVVGAVPSALSGQIPCIPWKPLQYAMIGCQTRSYFESKFVSCRLFN